MSARVVTRTARRALVRPMFAALETLEVRTHVLGTPGCVAGQVRKLIPVGIVRVDQNQRVVRGAAPERARPRIEDTVHLLALERAPVLQVLLLSRLILVVPDEEVPADAVVLRRQRMK